MTKRRIKVQKVPRARTRASISPNLDPRDPQIVRAKEHLYAAGRPRRAA